MTVFNQRPFSIRIFVPDGDPDGLRLVEKSNWTGVGVVFNRSIFKQVLDRPEFERTGVYVLVGSSEDSTLPTIYIGEGDSVKQRLAAHYSQKDFWDWAVFFVTKDCSLNKAHVKHLESRLLGLAKVAKQCKLYSDQPSLPPTLSEAETADMESFLLDMLSIYPLLGLSVFEKTEVIKRPDGEVLQIELGGSILARGMEAPQGFVVLKGSVLNDSIGRSFKDGGYKKLRDDLIESGVIEKINDTLTFQEAYTFNSPSAAATVILARGANGRAEWKNADGVSLKHLQEKFSGNAAREE